MSQQKLTLAQKAARLDNLMDDKAPPTIYSTKLTPELSEAALNLTIDFQRQRQSGATSRMIKHPYTLGFIFAAFCVFAYWKVGAVIHRSGLGALKYHVEDVISVIVFTSMFACVVFHLINRPTEVIRDNADKIADKSEPVFGFDIKEFAALKAVEKSKLNKQQKEMLDSAENTSIVVYRDTPIAIVTVLPVPSFTDKARFVTKITAVGVRKVYWRSGIIEDLLDWAVRRSGQLNNSKASKILVCIEVVSTDHALKKVLTEKQFQYIEERPIDNNPLLSLYGVKNEIWGVGLNVTKLSETIKSRVGATGAKRKA